MLIVDLARKIIRGRNNMSLWTELKRRNVVRVAITYSVTAWVIVQAADLVLDIFGAPDSIIRVIAGLLILGLPITVMFAWAFERTPAGIRRESDVDLSVSGQQQTSQRLNILTIILVLVAIGFVVADRFFSQQSPVTADEVTAAEPSEQAADSSSEVENDTLRITQQLLEIEHLKDQGENNAAFNLARQVAPFLGEGYDIEGLWEGISWSTDIDSRPSGARVLQQPIDAAPDDWEEIGVTPLSTVRFPAYDQYRVRLELEGYRSVELLHEALWGADWRDEPPVNPVQLDRDEDLPEEMVRIPGFTQDHVEFASYFIDRYEVTNRDYSNFVSSGGYRKPEYWTETFLHQGRIIEFEDAMQEFADRTGRPGPAFWSGGAYASGEGDYPVAGLSWFEASAYARFVDKELPTLAHLEMAMRFFMENSAFIISRSNFGGEGPWSVSNNRSGNSLGVYDMAGNVREWCWNSMTRGQRCTYGAAWNDPPYNVVDIIPKSPWDRDPTHGFRLVRTFDSSEKTERLKVQVESAQVRDFMSETPVSDAEFNIYRRMYDYDDLPLNVVVVESLKFDFWTRERVEFDLANRDRGAAYLYIPHSGTVPYETVVYWPGSDALWAQVIDQEYLDSFEFLMKSGRVVAQPVFYGTYDRDDANRPINYETLWASAESTATTNYRDLQTTWIQELSRMIDYLETRNDVAHDRLGFYGFSWGGGLAPVVLAVESERINAAVLNVGGLNATSKYLPESDGFNFVTRVTTPVLMVNGEYDIVVPLETAQKPLYNLLGTDPQHKKMVVVPSAHLVPEDVLIREALDWFDRYLGQEVR